jgi:cystathionine beta-lyase/cystathionine gamma-synthase
MRPDDLCPRPSHVPPLETRPASPPIYLASVYECESPDQADAMLAGKPPGYVYQRDGHPNADLFAEKCRELHAAERAAVTSSGMSAMALAVLSQLAPGDHVVVSSMLYGKNQLLLTQEAARWGIKSTIVDTCDLPAVEAACTPATKLIVAETIANPLLQVADIGAQSEIAHRLGAKLLVDNTFATPILCRPLILGADLVLESVTKMMNGHSDVMLGVLCGPAAYWQRVPLVLSAWGLASPAFEAWLALRGLATLALRVEQASANALVAAEFLAGRKDVARVDYPGLTTHPQHALAARQFGGRFGSMVTFHLPGGRPAAAAFIKAARRIPFCPSLGEVSTTLSHPESTSHRGHSPEARAALGITGGTIRLSVGCESAEFVCEALAEGLAGVS